MFRTSVEENLATVLIGFGIYESVYTDAEASLLYNVSGTEMSVWRAFWVIVVVVGVIVAVRLKEAAERPNCPRYHLTILLAVFAGVASIMTAYAGFGPKPSFCLFLGFAIYAFLIERSSSHAGDSNASDVEHQ